MANTKNPRRALECTTHSFRQSDGKLLTIKTTVGEGLTVIEVMEDAPKPVSMEACGVDE